MKTLITISILLLGSLLMHPTAAQDITGNWKITDLQGSIELKTLPINIIKKVKKGMVGNSFEYHEDGTYTGNGFKEKTGGKYAIRQGEIYHYDFLDHLSLKGKLEVDGDNMHITVKREDFLNTLSQNYQGKLSEEQLNTMYNISDEIVYVLNKM